MTTVHTKVSGTEAGQRQLNGPQTSGREYRNLSEPVHDWVRVDDVAVPMRDGISLLADVYRPASDGAYPTLISASPYPRQIQDLGAPMGFIEAGASDFFVPRGYVHVVVSIRGTGGSGGTYGLLDPQERHDMFDLVEWAAAQPWSDGNIGMVGISYFAMTQLEAAVEQPPHLKAIFPVATTSDPYEATSHHGLLNSSFITPFLAMIGMASGHGDELWRGKLLDAARHVLRTPPVHKRFGTMNGEASIGVMRAALKLHHDPHPWDDLWRSAAVEHQVRDTWWDERNLLPLLADVRIPVYLGCDWENVPLHLPSTFPTFAGLSGSPEVRMTLLGDYGLTWPWESLHIEALAWFDHWLKGVDTGVLDGPRIRYWLPEADEWRTADTWPPPEATLQEFALSSDGILSSTGAQPGSRSYLTLGGGLNRAAPSPTDPAVVSHLDHRTAGAGPGHGREHRARAMRSSDSAGHRLDRHPARRRRRGRRPGRHRRLPAGHPARGRRGCEHSRKSGALLPVAVPIGETVTYRIPIVPNARRFQAGHRIRLFLTSNDQDPASPAIMGFRHATVGTSSINTIDAESRLLLP